MLKQNQSMLVKIAIIISAIVVIVSLSYLMGWKNCYQQFTTDGTVAKVNEQKTLSAGNQSMPVAPVLPTNYKK